MLRLLLRHLLVLLLRYLLLVLLLLLLRHLLVLLLHLLLGHGLTRHGGDLLLGIGGWLGVGRLEGHAEIALSSLPQAADHTDDCADADEGDHNANDHPEPDETVYSIVVVVVVWNVDVGIAITCNVRTVKAGGIVATTPLALAILITN